MTEFNNYFPTLTDELHFTMYFYTVRTVSCANNGAIVSLS